MQNHRISAWHTGRRDTRGGRGEAGERPALLSTHPAAALGRAEEQRPAEFEGFCEVPMGVFTVHASISMTIPNIFVSKPIPSNCLDDHTVTNSVLCLHTGIAQN